MFENSPFLLRVTDSLFPNGDVLMVTVHSRLDGILIP